MLVSNSLFPMSIKFEFLDCKQQKTTESNLSRIGIYWDEFVAKPKVKKKKLGARRDYIAEKHAMVKLRN